MNDHQTKEILEGVPSITIDSSPRPRTFPIYIYLFHREKKGHKNPICVQIVHFVAIDPLQQNTLMFLPQQLRIIYLWKTELVLIKHHIVLRNANRFEQKLNKCHQRKP